MWFVNGDIFMFSVKMWYHRFTGPRDLLRNRIYEGKGKDSGKYTYRRSINT